MSHFTRLKTRIVDKEHLISALEALGYEPQEGELTIGGFGRQKTDVEVRIGTGVLSYPIGFRKTGDTYECVADWWGVRGVNRNTFMRKLHQRYAYETTRAELEKQGFDVVEEEEQEEGRIHLVLRRMA